MEEEIERDNEITFEVEKAVKEDSVWIMFYQITNVFHMKRTFRKKTIDTYRIQNLLVNVLFHSVLQLFGIPFPTILDTWISGAGVVSWTCDPVLAQGQRFDSHSRRSFCCNPLG